MAIFGSLAALRVQAPASPGFGIAFTYVADLMVAGSSIRQRVGGLGAGEVNKVDLGAGVFVLEQAYETKPRAEAFFESHRRYIDIQIIVEGEEAMEVADIGRMQARQAYDSGRDLLIYDDVADASLLRVFPGQAAIFFPEDVHMPTVRVRAAAVLVRKCVVKVPANLPWGKENAATGLGGD